MKDKSIYNNNFDKEFPKPEVPADEAWKQMHELLVKNNLTEPKKKDKRRLVIFWILIFLFFTIGVSGYLLFDSAKINKAALSNVTVKTEVKTNDHSEINYDSVATKITKKDAVNSIAISKRNSVGTSHLSIQKERRTIKEFNAISKRDDQSSDINNKAVAFDKDTGNNTRQHNLTKDTLTATFTGNNVDTTANSNTITDTSSKKNNISTTIKSHAKSTVTYNIFHFGLQWNADFSLNNNKNYFNGYNSGSQYYMWLLPSAWAKIDINKKNGVLVNFNPYKQQFAGSQTVHIEKPWIASVEPDVVTRVIKTSAINVGLNYMYQFNKELSVQAGADYSFIQNVLYKEQSVDEISGDILSEKIYGAKHKDAAFSYINPSYFGWNIAVQYNFSKLSVGAGFSKPFKNISADSNYTVRPLNASIYLRYRFK